MQRVLNGKLFIEPAVGKLHGSAWNKYHFNEETTCIWRVEHWTSANRGGDVQLCHVNCFHGMGSKFKIDIQTIYNSKIILSSIYLAQSHNAKLSC